MSGLSYAKCHLKRSIFETLLENNYSDEERNEALEFFRGGCAYCGEMPAPVDDHLIPVLDRGDRVRCNMVPACHICNNSKGRKEYHDWMLNSTSKDSLKGRNVSAEEIEKRIQIIEKWQNGYKVKTEGELFGENLGRYNEILKKMDDLFEDAQKLANEVKSQKQADKKR